MRAHSHVTSDAIIQSLTAQNAMLRAENEQLLVQLAKHEAAREFLAEISEARPFTQGLKLSPMQAQFLRLLLSADFVRKEAAYNVLYGHLIDGGPEPKILDVVICRVRAKVRPLGVTIKTEWGRGWRIPDRAAARNKLLDHQPVVLNRAQRATRAEL